VIKIFQLLLSKFFFFHEFKNNLIKRIVPILLSNGTKENLIKGLNLKPFVDKFHFFYTQFSFRSINEMDEKKPLSNFFTRRGLSGYLLPRKEGSWLLLGEKGTKFFFPQGQRDLPSSPARKGLSYLLPVEKGTKLPWGLER
jgi:hypothetical protein